MGKTPELDNLSTSDPRIGYMQDTNIFDILSANKISWASYEQDIAFLRVFDRYRLNDTNILPLFKKDDVNNEYSDNEVFFTRLAAGKLPAVTFIDPNYVDIPPDITANDDHPPADVANGQELVRQIYNALVRSPQWEKTLFIITYDEHGGFFDHVPPPGTKASPQGENVIPKVHEDGPRFYGARVPTIVISPWVDAVGNSTIFDHTSIIKTILERFNNGDVPEALGERVKQAEHLGSLLTRNTPRPNPGIIETIPSTISDFLPLTESESTGVDFHDVIQRFALPRQ